MSRQSRIIEAFCGVHTFPSSIFPLSTRKEKNVKNRLFSALLVAFVVFVSFGSIVDARTKTRSHSVVRSDEITLTNWCIEHEIVTLSGTIQTRTTVVHDGDTYRYEERVTLKAQGYGSVTGARYRASLDQSFVLYQDPAVYSEEHASTLVLDGRKVYDLQVVLYFYFQVEDGLVVAYVSEASSSCSL